MRHLDAFECVLDFFLALGRGHAAIGEGEFDVFVDGKIADEIESLEDESDFAIANARAITELEGGDGLTVEGVVPFCGRIEKTEDGEESGLAAAGGTGDGEVFAFFDHEVNVVEGVSFEFVGEEDFTHVLQIDQRVIEGRHDLLASRNDPKSIPSTAENRRTLNKKLRCAPSFPCQGRQKAAPTKGSMRAKSG